MDRAFFEANLPAAPATVLEVGCGRGGLARELARLGHGVTAIDPEAPVGAIFQAVTIEEFRDPGPFDAVLANRALHHIPDLRGALAKIARLLRPGGRLIVNEHAWERLDEPTARWYLEQRAATDHHAPRSVEECLADWATDHAGLHTSAVMCEELDRCFERRYFAWTPYLHEELGDATDERTEQGLIEAGAIQATGFRYVGELGNRAIEGAPSRGA
jgi:SAM-dependent methyltransferase